MTFWPSYFSFIFLIINLDHSTSAYLTFSLISSFFIRWSSLLIFFYFVPNFFILDKFVKLLLLLVFILKLSFSILDKNFIDEVELKFDRSLEDKIDSGCNWSNSLFKN